jgi:hypothetical protein
VVCPDRVPCLLCLPGTAAAAGGLSVSFTKLGIAVGSIPDAVAVGDFNGDGIPDLAVANLESGTVSILLGSGNGTFTQASGPPITVIENPVALAIGDFNGDGRRHAGGGAGPD